MRTICLPISSVLLLSFGGLPMAASAAPVNVKDTYLADIAGTKYFVAEFRKAAGATASYELSSTLSGWGAPGTGGRPTIAESVSPTDSLVSVVRINQPVSTTNPRYFLRALGQATSSKIRAPMDFDGDGRTDYVVVRNTGGGPSGAITWFIKLSNGGTKTVVWGISSDSFTPADYDGDGKDDIAVWRSGQFHILLSETGATQIRTLGQTGDTPTVMGDYDGDGRDDPAVYRKVSNAGHFLYIATASNPFNIVTDVTVGPSSSPFPAPGDYDGDGKTDICVQASTGFFLRRSSDGVVESFPFGNPSDPMCAGDFDGDGKADTLAIRNSAGAISWSILERDGGGTGATPLVLGASASDQPVPGDYDGDGKMDIAVWKPGTPGIFTVRRSSDEGIISFAWGQTGDFPVVNTRIH